MDLFPGKHALCLSLQERNKTSLKNLGGDLVVQFSHQSSADLS